MLVYYVRWCGAESPDWGQVLQSIHSIPICSVCTDVIIVMRRRSVLYTDIDLSGWRIYGSISTIEYSIRLYAQTQIISHLDIYMKKNTTHPPRPHRAVYSLYMNKYIYFCKPLHFWPVSLHRMEWRTHIILCIPSVVSYFSSRNFAPGIHIQNVALKLFRCTYNVVWNV